MSGLEERLRAAVGAELHADPNDSRPLRVAVGGAILAGLQVLADELGAGRDEPPGWQAARELPRTPGSVVLAATVRGERFDPPLPLLRVYGKRWQSMTEDVQGEWTHADEHVGDDWQPARVVPDDWSALVAADALRHVVRLLDGPQPDKAQQAQDVAKRALSGLGEPPW